MFVMGCGPDKQTQSQAEPAEQPAQRNAQDVLTGMRLKQLTKSLQLTEDQQAKFKVLFDEEGVQIAKIHDDPNLSLTEQTTRIGELKKETYGKIKPLLTPEQLETFEKQMAKSSKRKK